MSAKIFLSYSWENKLEADKIDNFLRDQGYYVQRDIREAHYKRNIKDFMKSIDESDFVIPLISDTFLRSHNCMYEILELTRNSDYKERVLQVILNDAKIFKPIDRAKYLEFWTNECTQLESILNSNIPENAKNELKRDFRDYKEIEKTIYDFTTFLSDEIGVTLNVLEKTKFKTLLDYIGSKFIYEKPIIKSYSEILKLEDFKIGEKYYGKVKLIFNYGFFVQIHSDEGYREGILHRSKLESLGYSYSQLKRFLVVGDDVHVEISEINPFTPSAKISGGLGFEPTNIFELKIFEKITKYIINASNKNDEVLNLSGFALRDLPLEIKKMKNLKRLFISGNKFTDMPEILESLPNLKTVFCDFKPSKNYKFEYIIYK